MKVILDTDIIIECLKNNEQVIKKVKQLHSKGYILSYTPISLAEIYCGIRKGEENKVKIFFLNLNCVAIDERMGVKAGTYLNEFYKSHHLDVADTIIAAATFVQKAKLYTKNLKHYPMKDIEFIK